MYYNISAENQVNDTVKSRLLWSLCHLSMRILDLKYDCMNVTVLMDHKIENINTENFKERALNSPVYSALR